MVRWKLILLTSAMMMVEMTTLTAVEAKGSSHQKHTAEKRLDPKVEDAKKSRIE